MYLILNFFVLCLFIHFYAFICRIHLYDHHFVQMVDCIDTQEGTADEEPSENLRNIENKVEQDLLSNTKDYGTFLLLFT